jgi:hypothetical protein
MINGRNLLQVSADTNLYQLTQYDGETLYVFAETLLDALHKHREHMEEVEITYEEPESVVLLGARCEVIA